VAIVVADMFLLCGSAGAYRDVGPRCGGPAVRVDERNRGPRLREQERRDQADHIDGVAALFGTDWGEAAGRLSTMVRSARELDGRTEGPAGHGPTDPHGPPSRRIGRDAVGDRALEYEIRGEKPGTAGQQDPHQLGGDEERGLATTRKGRCGRRSARASVRTTVTRSAGKAARRRSARPGWSSIASPRAPASTRGRVIAP
jgi:hypothetical protein